MSKDQDYEDEKEARAEEQSAKDRAADEALLVKMRNILDKSVDWWSECVEAKRGKGIGSSKDSAITAFQMIEKIEARLTGQSMNMGEWRVVFSKLPEDCKYEDGDECHRSP